MYHIDSNGKILCGISKKKHPMAFKFSNVYRLNLQDCCPICKQEYLKEIDIIANKIDEWKTSIS